jgi:hypothetical protein
LYTRPEWRRCILSCCNHLRGQCQVPLSNAYTNIHGLGGCGWVAEEPYRTLDLISRRRFLRTAGGERRAEKIEARLQPAADAATRVAFDPRGALAVVAALRLPNWVGIAGHVSEAGAAE